MDRRSVGAGQDGRKITDAADLLAFPRIHNRSEATTGLPPFSPGCAPILPDPHTPPHALQPPNTIQALRATHTAAIAARRRYSSKLVLCLPRAPWNQAITAAAAMPQAVNGSVSW